MLSKCIEFSSKFFPDFRHPGEAFLKSKHIDQEQLKQLHLSGQQQYNLFHCVMTQLIPVHLIQDYLDPSCRWSLNQLHAMLTPQGMDALSQHELAPRDFCNEFISEDLTPQQVLQQLRSLKQLRMGFFQQASSEFKKQSREPLDSSSSHLLKSPPSPYYVVAESKKTVIPHPLPAGGCAIYLPANEGTKVIQAAIYHARKFRKQGYSELETNDRTPQEYDDILNCLSSNRHYARLAKDKIIEDLRKKGFVQPNNEQALVNGAFLHFKIASSHQTFLGNCDELAALVLDYYDQIDYQHPLHCAKITYRSGEAGGHTVMLLNCPTNGKIIIS